MEFLGSKVNLCQSKRNVKNSISQIIQTLKSGGTILYPTDTIWGIGCDAMNADAVDKIYSIKKRDKSKSLIALVNSIAMLERYVIGIPSVCYDLIETSNKPLTIIYEKCLNISTNALAADGSMAFRVCKDPWCTELIKQFNRPLISTSANISNNDSPAKFDEISLEIKNQVDYIVSLRTDEIMKTASTILKINNDSSFKIIRK